MRIVAIDFESFFSTKDGYTLTKIGPISYIRDSRFSAQLMSYIVTDASTMTYDRVRVAEHDNIPAVLAALKLDAPDVVTVAHNGNGFDFLILSEIYHVVPRIAIDTMCMERWTGVSRIQNESLKSMAKFFKCGEKVEGTAISDGRNWPEDFTPDERTAFIQYCRNDTEQCFLSFKAMLPFMTADALLFSSITAKMACNPVLRLDDDMLTAYLKELSAKVTKARNDINRMFMFKSDEDLLKAIRSSASFVKMLELLGRKPPMKYSVAKSETKRKKLEAEGRLILAKRITRFILRLWLSLIWISWPWLLTLMSAWLFLSGRDWRTTPVSRGQGLRRSMRWPRAAGRCPLCSTRSRLTRHGIRLATLRGAVTSSTFRT